MECLATWKEPVGQREGCEPKESELDNHRGGTHEVVKQCDYCHNWACAKHITSLTTGDICDKCAGANKA